MPLANSLEHPSLDISQMSKSAQEASEFLKALANESRLMILCNLLSGEKSVGQLEEILELRQSTVSQQLARLRLEGLVSTRRDGKTIFYSIASDKVRTIIGALYDTFCAAKPSRAAQPTPQAAAAGKMIASPTD